MLTIQLTPFPELRTARLVLRQLRETDAPALLVLRSDPRIMRYLDREPDTDVAQSVAVVQELNCRLAAGAGIMWGICRLGDEETLLGTVGFWRLIPEHYRAEIGYTLHPNYWQQGIMGEALAAALHFGFNTLGLHSVEANTNPQNAASKRLLEKQGFVVEGYFRENYYFDGQFLDSAIYSLLAPKPDSQE